MKMTEPASTAAGGLVLYKLGAFGVVPVLAAIVVMCMTAPKTIKEFACALIVTLMFSIGGGGWIIKAKGLEEWVNDEFGLFALLGLVFVCGLPGWVMTRGFFAYAEYRKSGRSFMKMVSDITSVIKAVVWK
ncbi:hypothetical protein CJU05_24315 [Pseudomonas aeruginosa]|uniref:hypothetical protein n=1 Tax=Pseudomonas aeruginosa TaxID=287 RepID=UPI000BB8119D|nr:hypothetical protein [Pseudomonas aeruginosa]PCA77808.1 hypothetical protein CJU05_24315 [Pseudomonas aeruginosa]